MTEQPLDLRRIWAAIGRARVSFLACLAVAVLGAIVFTVANPPDYSAHALVLLPASSVDASGQPSRDIATQVRIASSADVLSIAARDLHPAPKVSELTRNVRVGAPTPDILQVTAKAASRSRAIAIANKVADSYVVYSVRGASDLVNQVVAQLNREVTNLTSQVADLQARTNAASTKFNSLPPESPEAATEATLLDDLRSQLADTSSQLNSVKNQINEVQLNSAVANSGTRILERATSARNASLLVDIRNFFIALVLGLIVGTMTAVLRDGHDRRLRRRDDIASAAGVPAVASITTDIARSAEEWLALIANYEPSVDESWGLRRTLRHLVTAHDAAPARASIVCLAGDEAAFAVAPQLATFSARAGVRTVLLIDRQAANVSPLRDAAPATDGTRDAVIPNLWLLDPQAAAAAADHVAPQLVVNLVLAEGGRIDGAVAERNTTTLLAVSAGFATPEAITAVALAATETGRPLFGVVVANPRPDDDSSGRIPQPVAGNRPRLPSRLTGSARGSQ